MCFLNSTAASIIFAGLAIQSSYADTLILEDINVEDATHHLDTQEGSASEGKIKSSRLKDTPISRPGEVLEKIPGLIVSQHSGDGKANQYYLRGFNLDHGTDFAVWLDGMPLNMRTHAHGQGYIDSNLLIPELIEYMHYYKGSYHAEQGDFSAAGFAHLNYAKQLPHGLASITTGSYGFQRILNANTFHLEQDALTYAIEAQTYDGAWENSQNLKKLNGFLKYQQGDKNDGWGITLMAYDASWNASDQIPQRAIINNITDRFGSIDSTDGGKTSRYSISADWHNESWQAHLYAIHYKLNLFSNFTYFLNDPINGDQFEQADKRNIWGGSIHRVIDAQMGDIESSHTFGMDTRYDDIRKLGLYQTVARKRINTTREDSVKQASMGLWWQGNWSLSSEWRASTGLRYDRYYFNVDSLLAENSGNTFEGILSPKLGLAWQAKPAHTFYANWGQGFHSNDARGVVTRIDPTTRQPNAPVDALVKAVSKELGWRGRLMQNWQSTLTLFQLDLDSELVFIGDAGNTEASHPSRRLGLEWTNDIQLNRQSYIDADFALTHARFRNTDSTNNYIPGAVAKIASIAIVSQLSDGWSASAKLRYFGPRPLTEDNAIKSSSTSITNLRLGYQIHPKVLLNLDIFNIFNRKVSDIDYFYTSRLSGESAQGVDDVHTHPAEPRMARLSMIINY